jgi:hypothetical protein
MLAVALIAISPAAAWETPSAEAKAIGVDPPTNAPEGATVAGTDLGLASNAQPPRKPAS